MLKYIFNRFQIKEGREVAASPALSLRGKCKISLNCETHLAHKVSRKEGDVKWSKKGLTNAIFVMKCQGTWPEKTEEERKKRNKNESRPGPDLGLRCIQDYLARDNEDDVRDGNIHETIAPLSLSRGCLTAWVNNEIKDFNVSIWTYFGEKHSIHLMTENQC